MELIFAAMAGIMKQHCEFTERGSFMNVFVRADILLPQAELLDRWPVIACDQFTSDMAYWNRVREFARDVPSAMHLILPEAELGSADEEEKIISIHSAMERYLADGVLRLFPNCYIYVERTLQNGMIRPGLIGAVDLEKYDFRHDSTSLIRATEKTVLERIPPRQRVRRGAALELPHVMMLCDDEKMQLIEPIQGIKDSLPKLYELDLVEDGGHIAGYLVSGETAEAFDRRLAAYAGTLDEKYPDLSGAKVLLAVGDGNHSLATAKSCYEELKMAHPDLDLSNHPARYALVELENIHDASQQFEPIHRVVMKTDADKLLSDLQTICRPGGYPVTWIMGNRTGVLELNRDLGELDVAVLQNFLDEWLHQNEGKIDYIHGEEDVAVLARQENALGLLLQPMGKSQLFRGVIAGGILPRKTFSMGHAREKRYYLEGRKIK